MNIRNCPGGVLLGLRGGCGDEDGGAAASLLNDSPSLPPGSHAMPTSKGLAEAATLVT